MISDFINNSFVNTKISMKYSLLFYIDHFHLFSRETNLMVKKIMIYTPIPNFLPVSHNESVIKDSILDSWWINIEFSMEDVTDKKHT